MIPSNRRPSVEVFSMLFGVVYLTCFYLDWAPFRYYPDARTFHLKATPQDGPAILWYGWVTAGAVVSAVVAALVPRRVAEAMRPSWVGVVALVTVLLLLLYERRWFL